MPRSRVRPFVFALLVVVVSVLVGACAFVGCIPGYTFGEAAGGEAGDAGSVPAVDGSFDGTVDSTSDSSIAPEASSDAGQDSAPPPFDGSIVALAIVDAGSKVGSTGYGYQLHVVFAENDHRYWYFYVDDTAGEIKSLSSPDFATWTPGAAISLGSDYQLVDGNNFSVAYANIGGHDVVHIVADAHSQTTGYATLHVRAAIGTGLTASAPVVLPLTTNGGPCTNDGPATTITPDGRVYDVTAWTAHDVSEGTNCDTDIYLAPGVDVGTSWTPGTFGYDGYYVSVPELAFSHDLLNLPDAGLVMVLFPDQDTSATNNYFSMGWALSTSFDGGKPDAGLGVFEPSSFELFTSNGTQSSFDDWSACRLADDDVHVVRHVLNAALNSVVAFEEVVFDGNTWQAPATQPPQSTSLTNTGLALVSGVDPAKGMLLVSLGADFTLNVSKWTAAGGWTHAGKLPGGASTRQSLSGSGCGSARPTVFWTETTGASNVIESADLSGLLQ